MYSVSGPILFAYAKKELQPKSNSTKTRKEWQRIKKPEVPVQEHYGLMHISERRIAAPAVYLLLEKDDVPL